MKGEFVKYFKSIGIMTQPLLNRIEQIYEFCSEICPDEIVDVFVDDYIKEDGTREYEDITFFSNKYLISVLQFLTKDESHLTPIKKKMLNCTIHKKDYDFKKATEKSRLYLNFNVDSGSVGKYKASKENCDYLKQIIFKHVIPNLKD